MKEKFLKYLGLVDIDVLDYSILVSIGKSKKQIEAFLIKQKAPKQCIKDILSEANSNSSGIFLYNYTNLGFLEMKNFDGSWKWLDTPNHEVAHFVDFISKDFSFADETEFKAYLHESTNKKIRRILFKACNRMK